MFVCISVGDCKAFHLERETNKIHEITKGSRTVALDASDPGGRIGPYLENGAPDLRNLQLYFHRCNEGDLIYIVSDGVYDNLDPQQLGLVPLDFGIRADSWDALPFKDTSQLFSNFRIEMMKTILFGPDGYSTPKATDQFSFLDPQSIYFMNGAESSHHQLNLNGLGFFDPDEASRNFGEANGLFDQDGSNETNDEREAEQGEVDLDGDLLLEEDFNIFNDEISVPFDFAPGRTGKTASPQLITSSLLRHALENTYASRDFMIRNPTSRLPSNYRRYPGKMDHTTCLTFRVGSVPGSSIHSHSAYTCEMDPTTRRIHKVKNWNFSNASLAESFQLSIGNQQQIKPFHPRNILPVSLTVPLQVSISESNYKLVVYCHTIPQGQLQATAFETQLLLQVTWPANWSTIHEQFGNFSIFGSNELDNPVERVVQLPSRVIPESEIIRYDTTTGIITIAFDKQPVDTVAIHSITLG